MKTLETLGSTVLLTPSSLYADNTLATARANESCRILMPLLSVPSSMTLDCESSPQSPQPQHNESASAAEWLQKQA